MKRTLKITAVSVIAAAAVLTGITAAGAAKKNKYTGDDLSSMQDHLLGKTPAAEGADYDADNDGEWTSLDLCIMRKEAVDAMKEKSCITIEVNGHTLTAELADNEAARALAELAEEGFTAKLNEYGGFEKVGKLPQSLPKSDERITTEAGDIMLYQGNQMTIFYGSNAWSYTKLGHITGVSQQELNDIFGSGDVTEEISLNK